jgi:hypothetical protein
LSYGIGLHAIRCSALVSPSIKAPACPCPVFGLDRAMQLAWQPTPVWPGSMAMDQLHGVPGCFIELPHLTYFLALLVRSFMHSFNYSFKHVEPAAVAQGGSWDRVAKLVCEHLASTQGLTSRVAAPLLCATCCLQRSLHCLQGRPIWGHCCQCLQQGQEGGAQGSGHFIWMVLLVSG